MSSKYEQLKGMIETVARALGDDLLEKFVFVGGCTTGLLITDDFSKEEVRYTDDVDLIINVVGHAQWAELQNQLRNKGFMESMEDDVICRMRLGDLKVDFMPDDEDILGFSNQWYAKGLELAQDYSLADDLTIKLLTPPFFVATKLEAYLGRGDDDPLASHDLEDILNLVDGREELVEEIEATDEDVRNYIAEQIGLLLEHRNFDYAVQGITRGDKDRASLIFERLETVKAMKVIN
jgi:predicted nucleotidyltransferase